MLFGLILDGSILFDLVDYSSRLLLFVVVGCRGFSQVTTSAVESSSGIDVLG